MWSNAKRHIILGHGNVCNPASHTGTRERSQFIRRYGISITQVHVEEENEIYTYRPQYLTDVDSSNLFLIDFFYQRMQFSFLWRDSLYFGKLLTDGGFYYGDLKSLFLLQ